MKNSKSKMLAVVTFTVMLSVPAKQAIADNMRPECAEWKRQLEETVDPVPEGPSTYREGKGFQDLLFVLKSYPAATPYTVRDVEKNLVKQTVDSLMGMPGCADIHFYDTSKRFFNSKKLNLKESRQILSVILERIVKADDESPSLITLSINLSLLDMAIHSNVLVLSDAAYFSFIQMQRDVDVHKNLFRVNGRKASAFDCTAKKTCSDAEYETVLALLLKEHQATKPLQHWLAGWAQRIGQNKQGK